MDLLATLKASLDEVSSSAAVASKKAFEQLASLWSNPAVLELVSQGRITVVHMAERLIDGVEKNQERFEKKPATGPETRRAYAEKALRGFLHAVDSGAEPRLQTGVVAVFRHVVATLDSESLHAEFIEEYSAVLVSHIFNREQYRHILWRSARDAMLMFVTRCVRPKLAQCGQVSMFDLAHYARFLEAVVEGCPEDLDVLFDELREMWASHVRRCKHEKPLTVTLGALNAICRGCAVNRVAEVVALAGELRGSLVRLVNDQPRAVALHSQVVEFFRLLCTVQIHPSGVFAVTEGMEEVFGMATTLLFAKSRASSSEHATNSLSESLVALHADLIVHLACTLQSFDPGLTGGEEEAGKRRKVASTSAWWENLTAAALSPTEAGEEAPNNGNNWARLQTIVEVMTRYAAHVPVAVLQDVWLQLHKLSSSPAVVNQPLLFALTLNALSCTAKALRARDIRPQFGSMHNLLEKLPTASVAVQDAIYSAIGGLVSTGLAEGMMGDWWDVVLQQKCRPSVLTLLLTCLQHLPISDATARVRLLRYALDGYDPLVENPSLVVAVVLAVLQQGPTEVASSPSPPCAGDKISKALAEISSVRLLSQSRAAVAHAAHASVVAIIPAHIRLKLEEMLIAGLQRKSELTQHAGNEISGKRRRTLGVDAALLSEKLLSGTRLLRLVMHLHRALESSETVANALQEIFSTQLEFVVKFWNELSSRPKKQAEIMTELLEVTSSPLCGADTTTLDELVEACTAFVQKNFLVAGPAAAGAVAAVDEFGFGPSASGSDDMQDCVAAVFRLLGSLRCFHESVGTGVDAILGRAFDMCQSDAMHLELVSSVLLLSGDGGQPPVSVPRFAAPAVMTLSVSLANYMMKAKLRHALLDALLRGTRLLEKGSCNDLAEPLAEILELIVSQWWKPRCMSWESRRMLAQILSKITLLELFTEQQQVLFGNVHLLLLKDPDFRVRLQVCRDISVLFAVYEEHESLYQTILDMLSPMLASGTSVDTRLTPLITLGSIARVSRVNELNIAFQFCSSWSETSLSAAILVLEGVACDLGYTSLASYLAELLPDLFSVWFGAGLKLAAFPFQFLGFRDAVSFFVAHVAAIVPKCVFYELVDELQYLAKQCGTVVKVMLIEHLPAVYAHVQPLFSCGKQDKGRRVMEVLLPKLGVTEQVVSQEISGIRFDSFLFALLDVVSTTSEGDHAPQPPVYSQSVVKAVFVYLGNGFGASSVTDIIFRTKDRVHKIVLFLHEQYAASHRPHRKLAALRKLGLLMEMVRAPSASAKFQKQVMGSVFRDVLHFLLQALTIETLVPLACALLRDLCDSALASHAEELRKNLVVIVTSLVPLVDGGRREATELVNYLVVEKIDVFKDLIAGLDPVPEGNPAFDRVRKMQAKYGGVLTLSQQLERFASSRSASTDMGSRIALSHLLRLLESHRQDLALLAGTAVLGRVAWALIKLCSAVKDREQLLLAAACLGELGDVELREDSASMFPAIVLADHVIVEEVVRQVHAFLVDEDVHVIRAASLCMRDLLATADGGAAFKNLLRTLQGAMICEHLYPFRPLQSKQQGAGTTPMMFGGSKTQGNVLLPDDRAWECGGKSFADWVRPLCSQLGLCVRSAQYFALVAPVCALKTQLAEFLFPFAIRAIAQEDEANVQSQSMPSIADAMERLVLCEAAANPEAVQLVLKTMTVLRLHQWKRKTVKMPSAWHASQAALRCSLFVSSLQFLELSCEAEFGSVSLSAIESDPAKRAIYHAALRRIYSNLDEPDSLHGIHAGEDTMSSILLYEHEGRWDQALSGYDRLLAYGQQNVALKSGLLRAMGNLGLVHMWSGYLAGVGATNVSEYMELSEYQLELAWRTCRWEENDPKLAVLLSSRAKLTFNQAALQCLRGLHGADQALFQSSLDGIRLELLADLSVSTLENTKSAGPTLSRLRFFREIESCWSVCLANGDGKERAQLLAALDRECRERNAMIRSSRDTLAFEDTEKLMSLRVGLCSALGSNELMPRHLLELTRASLKCGRLNIALGTLHRLKEIQPDSLDGMLAEAKVMWARGDGDAAIALAKKMIGRLEKNPPPDGPKSLYGKALFLCGRWLTQTGNESASTIRSSYLKLAFKKFQPQKGFGEDMAKVSFMLGKHADGLYSAITAKMKTPEWNASKEVRMHRQKELQELEKLLKNSNGQPVNVPELQKHIKRLRGQIQEDEAEFNKMEKDRRELLVDAVRCYANALICGDKYDMAVFGLCNLWFEDARDKIVSEYVQKKLAAIPSAKWLPLSYQIASHLGLGEEASADFNEVVEELVVKLACEHPHHMLFKLLALCNGRNLPQNHRGKPHHVVDEGKINAANAIVARLKKLGSGSMLQSYEALWGALVQLAYYDMPSRDKALQMTPEGPQEIPSNFGIRALNQLSLPISTVPQPTGVVVPEDVPKIDRFESSYELVGGINRPKRLRCIGSNGRVYQQLLKGGDDLKQDAIMQQLFSFANRLLAQDPSSRSRNLHIRSYSVIPLTPAAGVLEWVENSIALGNYLTNGSRAAHVHYRPKDLSHAEVYGQMKHAADEKKVDTFLSVCKRFIPVMHNFFLEKFRDPFTWFEKRLRYSRSLATSSIVGFVIGLGDRHMQNILIDENSADVIHIDLGVAFDQGRALPIPETVPFRLTRDMVDGLGISGTEGVFRRCCEETMKVLRSNSSSLMTILQVFLHDPLYQWTLSPLQALQKQGRIDSSNQPEESSSVSGNRDAHHAMLRIRQKLQGVENGEVLGVEGHVAMLINEARDPNLLAKLYVGWAAWC